MFILARQDPRLTPSTNIKKALKLAVLTGCDVQLMSPFPERPSGGMVFDDVIINIRPDSSATDNMDEFNKIQNKLR